MSCDQLTQNQRLLAYLKRRKYITRAPAFTELGIANLWQRCRELRDMGYRIESRWHKTPDGAHVKQYWLAEGRQKRAA
ncbi:MAG: hypothetical protein IRZ07_00730 [Microbispora sp.]|nr:hypothetical protein [Microbispora sp.]